MFQPDLFAPEAAARPERLRAPRAVKPPLDLPGILERLAHVCERPRYSFMVLNLIAKASAKTGEAGPYVDDGDNHVAVRDWLSDALSPVAQRDPRRLAIAKKVRQELQNQNALPEDEMAAQSIIDEKVRDRIRLSGRTQISRAVSELVRAGLVHRYYKGYRVDHENRGAGRQVIYSVTEEARGALQLG